MGTRWMAIALALGMPAMMAAAPAPPAEIDTSFFQKMRQADQEGAAGHFQAAQGLLREVITDAAFKSLPERMRLAILQNAVFVSERLDKPNDAYGYAMQATALSNAPLRFWYTRVVRELADRRFAAAVETIETMALRDPDALNALPLRVITGLDMHLEQEVRDPVLLKRFMKTLSNARYAPDEVGAVGDYYRRKYASMLADDGDDKAAAALIAQIIEPSYLIDISVDSRLRTMLPADFDGRKETERALARARDVAASHVGSIMAVTDVARLLRMLGRHDEALTTLEAARPEGEQAKTFTDLKDNLNWWWDSLSTSYQMLGRYDEAVAALRKGVDAGEYGEPNVSQAINLASLQLRFGRPADALTTLEALKAPLSPFGETQVRLFRGCSNFEMKRDAAAKADIAYAAAHEKDSIETSMDLLLCAGDMDGAAAVAIRWLDDPERRSDALLIFSEFDPLPSNVPMHRFEKLWPVLAARADVQAAIKRAGGTRRFHLQSTEVG